MDESKIRYRSLLVIGIQILVAYAFICLILSAYYIPILNIPGEELSIEVIVIIIVFTIFAVLILLSVFIKECYPALTLYETAVFLYLSVEFIDEGLWVLLIFFAILAALPHISYYKITKAK